MAGNFDEIEEAFDDSYSGEIPPGIDEAAVERMRTVARVFDDLVRVPGTEFRIGLDPILGAVPVAGDAVSAGLSLYVVLESARLGVSFSTLLRMLANVTLDAVVGSIPIVGSVFDAVWKANKRNLELALEDLTAEADREEREESEPIVIEVE
ncbi:protein of unknown function [Halogranum amylolyticum]|uniref:DUF4112 domain-containing protein n=1 Tax=Halogranum amylolyticum TaxID=660520 RepID=A0A1H8WAF4_9EURY|nr:DUF4112 domain-containing protein [Halogranum amylolyticum]SEP24108.1 protein of unknown function [Halogranum amylolyticum]